MITHSRRYHYLAGLSISLVVAALVAGTTGCPNMGPYDYDFCLCISSTLGGVVTEPGEGDCFAYCANTTTVELIAQADEHCHFANWTGDVDTIDDVNDASTNITFITLYDCYSITANFELDPGCNSLTILNNYGGSVVESGEGYFPYVANTTIDLFAEPDEDYRFRQWTGDVDAIADVNAAATNITMHDNYSITANFEWFDIIQIAAGHFHTAGLKANGTVVAVGLNNYQQCEVGGRLDIIQVAAGDSHTVGLEADGTVLAVGWNGYGQCNVRSWTGITQVAAGLFHTVGVKADGTIVAVGNNTYGQCDVSGWTNITQVAAGWDHTVGRKADGTLVAAGDNTCGQCNVSSWTNIIQVAAGAVHTVGLKDDGTVVAVGEDFENQCDVDNWTDITQVAAGVRHTLGLKNDGTVVAVGWGSYGECNVGGWEP